MSTSIQNPPVESLKKRIRAQLRAMPIGAKVQVVEHDGTVHIGRLLSVRSGHAYLKAGAGRTLLDLIDVASVEQIGEARPFLYVVPAAKIFGRYNESFRTPTGRAA